MMCVIMCCIIKIRGVECMADRRANSVVFGFDFQVNAAIVLLLENINEIESVRLEGNYEDIELELSDGRYVFAQAKAVTNASSDFSHVRENLKNSLKTLAEANEKSKQRAEKLILITNSPNPFKDDASRSCFWGPSRRDYETLPDSAKNLIKRYVEALNLSIDLSVFRVQVVPFETDVYSERYKAIKNEIDSFVGGLNISNPGISDKLLEYWHHCLMANAGSANASIKLQKKDIVWPLIVITTDIRQYDSGMQEYFDVAEYDEIVRNYGRIIDQKCERFEFISKVLYDYKTYVFTGSQKAKTESFIENCWNSYLEDLETLDVEEEIKEQLLKVIIYSVLRQRHQINRIKKGVGM